MGFSMLPRYSFREITDVSPRLIMELGVRFLMLDLDNTLASYSEHSPADNVAQWVAEMKNCGIKLFIVSNSVRKGRVETFADALGIGYIKGASKPSPKVILRTINEAGFLVSESALVGDQIFTDTIAANCAGAVSILVQPRSRKNPALALRYGLEAPFRAASKRKSGGFTKI